MKKWETAALLREDNISSFFVYMEALFMLGYRPVLHKRVQNVRSGSLFTLNESASSKTELTSILFSFSSAHCP